MITEKKQKKQISKKIIAFFLAVAFVLISNFTKTTFAEDEYSPADDYEGYQQYELFLKYEKAKKYEKYREYKEYKEKYRYASKEERTIGKEKYGKYKLFKKNPALYPHYVIYYEDYKKYRGYKNKYKPAKKYSKYKKYKKYKKYTKKKYRAYRNYETAENKSAWTRYRNSLNTARANIGEADLGCGIIDGSGRCLGPEISVGLWAYTKNELEDDAFRIDANKDYVIKNSAGMVLAIVASSSTTRVKYESGGKLRIHSSVPNDIYVEDGIIDFESADGNNTDIIFDAHRPNSSFDKYRSKIRLKFYDPDGSSNDRIWVINNIPLEQYVWGMGEITGTGDSDYNKVMTTMFRTYGYWKIKFSTKYAYLGFKVNTTAGDQIYYGYDWETNYPRIKEASEDTWGRLVMYLNSSNLNEVTLTPYSSWTDGRTRSFQERWGSSLYPWCQSVSDPYGKHASMSTSDLEKAGNHMVGLSANGALRYATDHGKNWDWILDYYFHNINLHKAY